jgi:hypothetical protein
MRASSSSTSAASTRVAGWRGANSAQQSSYGRIEVSNVPIFFAAWMISFLS